MHDAPHVPKGAFVSEYMVRWTWAKVVKIKMNDFECFFLKETFMHQQVDKCSFNNYKLEYFM